MPLFRNVSTEALPTRRSSLRFKHDPIVYDEQGWQTLPARVHYPTPPPSEATSSRSTLVQRTGTNLLPPAPNNKHSTRRGRRVDHIPRPRNSFICFRSEFYKLKKRNPGGYDQNEISKEAGRVWALLTPEEKQPFEEMAKKEKEDHQLKYPSYSYAPGKEKKAIASKRKASSKKKLSSKKLSGVCQDPADNVTPITLPSLPYFSPSSKDFRSALPTPSPQPESPATESDEMLDLIRPDNEPLIEFDKFNFIPASSAPNRRSSSPHNPVKKFEDLLIRHPSYDAVPEAFGFRPSLMSESAVDKYVPSMPTPQDVLSFANSSQNDWNFFCPTPTSIHDDWDPIAISMSSQEGGYDYVDFAHPYDFDSPDNGYGFMGNRLETEVIDHASPSASSMDEAYIEMSEFFNFNNYRAQ